MSAQGALFSLLFLAPKLLEDSEMLISEIQQLPWSLKGFYFFF